MNQVIMYIMGVCALIGGADLILGNKLGLGESFKTGFKHMGAMGLSMAGIISFVPVVSMVLQKTIAPICHFLSIDPAMIACILAEDMGGYQLAMSLAENRSIGLFSGIMAGSTIGSTITFTIPVSIGIISAENRKSFAEGVLAGIAVLPISLSIGGLFCGLSLGTTILQSLPLFLLCLMIIIGIRFYLEKTVRIFNLFAEIIRIISYIGLSIGAFQHMTGLELIPGFTPILESMKVVVSICIVMLGSIPFTAIIRRILNKPLLRLSSKMHVSPLCITGMLIGTVSSITNFTMMEDIDQHEIMINAAFLVSCTGLFAAHMGFTANHEPDLLFSMLVVKMLGGFLAVMLAARLSKRR